MAGWNELFTEVIVILFTFVGERGGAREGGREGKKRGKKVGRGGGGVAFSWTPDFHLLL